MKKLLLVVVASILLSGCAGKWTEEGITITMFTGATHGVIDPESGKGEWTRLGNYEASGIEILKEGDDYIVEIDESKTVTEYDKMKMFFDMGLKAGGAL